MTSVRVKRRLYTELDSSSPYNQSNHLTSKLSALYHRTHHQQTRSQGPTQLESPTQAPRRSDPLHEDHLIDHLEAIDPELATVENLSNAANSILIPPINIYNRRPTISLPKRPDEGGQDELGDHVEDLLHRRAIIKRTLRGVWSFLKTPQGIVTAIYGFLVAFWGAAIVFFLGKLINLHNSDTQGFWVEISSQIENALFTVTGIGFIPWRVVDTFRIFKIWRYKRLSRRLRKQAGLPPLIDEDDLPDPQYDPNYVHVLTDQQQAELHYQQIQFKKSQTWYRPHGTPTHRAFPINTALLVCLFIDGNSVFQCFLCGCMWGLNRFERPPWTTGTLIPASFLCGIVAVILIWRGGRRTRRTEKIQQMMKTALEVEKETRVPAGLTLVATHQLEEATEAGPA